jgi:hypothetical protein
VTYFLSDLFSIKCAKIFKNFIEIKNNLEQRINKSKMGQDGSKQVINESYNCNQSSNSGGYTVGGYSNYSHQPSIFDPVYASRSTDEADRAAGCRYIDQKNDEAARYYRQQQRLVEEIEQTRKRKWEDEQRRIAEAEEADRMCKREAEILAAQNAYDIISNKYK